MNHLSKLYTYLYCSLILFHWDCFYTKFHTLQHLWTRLSASERVVILSEMSSFTITCRISKSYSCLSSTQWKFWLSRIRWGPGIYIWMAYIQGILLRIFILEHSFLKLKLGYESPVGLTNHEGIQTFSQWAWCSSFKMEQPNLHVK